MKLSKSVAFTRMSCMQSHNDDDDDNDNNNNNNNNNNQLSHAAKP